MLISKQQQRRRQQQQPQQHERKQKVHHYQNVKQNVQLFTTGLLRNRSLKVHIAFYPCSGGTWHLTIK